MEEENLTTYRLKSQAYSNYVNLHALHNSNVMLLFNLYDNRLMHEKFLEYLFENLIENRQLVRYDFQKKIYSLYPSNSYFNFIILNKLKILTGLGLLCFLIRDINYKKRIFFRFIILKLSLNIILDLFSSKISLFYLLIIKRFRYFKTKIYRQLKKTCTLLPLYKFMFFNYLDCNFLIKKSISNNSYKKFYQLKFQ